MDSDTWIHGGISAAVIGFVSWLWRLVSSNDKAQGLLDQKIQRLERDLGEVKSAQVTIDGVKQVIEEAFDRRDKAVIERRFDYDKLHQLEMQEFFRKEIEQIIPRIVREVRGDSGARKP